MAIDLSSLEGFDTPLPSPGEAKKPAEETPSGKPLEIMLIDIEEDPDQPRKAFDPEAMEEMVASVKATGVISPVSVRPHPTRPNAWILNHGARRYRASVAAGKKTIRAFVDDTHDDYDQVIENLHRDDLSPLEISRFIERKLAEGDTKGKIAKRLSRPAKFVTIHLALIDAPASIMNAYEQGKTSSVETLYNLRALADKHPEQVAEWVEEQKEITRQAVDELAQLLTGKKKEKAKIGDGEPGSAGAGAGGAGEGEGGGGGGFSHEKNTRDSQEGDADDDRAGEGDQQPDVQKVPPHNPEHEKALTAAKKDDPSTIKKAVLLVEFDDRPAMVLLNRRPSTQGLLHIKYEDNGEEVEVDAARCKINCLIEATA